MRRLPITALAAFVLVSLGTTAFSAADVVDQNVLYVNNISSGLVFLDGQHISAPYRIVATEQQITVNDRVFFAIQDRELAQRADSIHLISSSSGHSVDNAPPLRGDGNRFGRSRPQNSRRFEGVWGRQRESCDNLAKVLASNLEQNAIVVCFDQESQYLSSMGDRHDFYSAFSDSPPSDEVLHDFLELAPSERRSQWSQLLNSFTPDAETRQWMNVVINSFDSVEEANLDHNSAVSRLRHASYPLTILGMLLGVVALGHTLRWPAVVDRDAAENAMKIAIALMLGMSCLDLVWTILAAQAGEMTELNPFAAYFIHSPWALAGFKAVATLGACGILYAMRRNEKIQLATWWMCLVCVLLTFRWVVVDSLIS
ncbi:DUF5658 family protein [Aureliella helgolandensis]|uniref:DUF5658 domain-containing protein n=1 Tax=Aureliella helgolandensis TaxID=2527968 RepID=A0A518G521_9BACT|nr:DUF5658 family protein [Aureliella helgolandensis]QDV23697.1 hypothetical protein Q31a_20020 [Aureliella helgolandensis]